MLIQKIGIILIISLFSIFVYLNIIFKTSNDVLINYYQDVLYNLTSHFDYKLTHEFLKNPSKSSSYFKDIKDYLHEFSTSLGIKDIYLSTVDLDTNKESLLVHGTNSDFKIGEIINSKFGIESYKTKQIISGNVKINKDTYYSFYSPILNENGDILALMAFNIPDDMFLRLTLNKFILPISLLLIVNIALTMLYIYIATIGFWKILKPIYILKNEVLNISNKILSVNNNVIFSTNEFNSIQILFLKSIKLINNFILSLIIYLEYIRFSISKVKLFSLEILNKIKSTMGYITKVSKSSEQVNNEVINLKNKMQLFSNDIHEIIDELKIILDSNMSAIKTCQHNNEFLNEFLMEITILIKKFQMEQIECKNLTVLSGKINDILENILTITNETKLLSLNASIVAISAGEDGKSFGVIAKEVGELSQNIIKSTSYIQQTLIKISETINSLNKESIEIFESFKIHSDKSKVFSSNLTEIYNSIKNITLYIRDISFSTEKINNKNEIILENVTFLSANSSSNLNSIKQIENLISKVNENALIFRKSFEDLDNNISQIKLELSEFKL